eukprot:111649_1
MCGGAKNPQLRRLQFMIPVGWNVNKVVHNTWNTLMDSMDGDAWKSFVGITEKMRWFQKHSGSSVQVGEDTNYYGPSTSGYPDLGINSMEYLSAGSLNAHRDLEIFDR